MIFNIDEADLHDLLSKYYGLVGKLKRLEGDVDINYCVTTLEHKFLLKICRPKVAILEVDFQVAIINHLNSHSFSFAIPSIYRSIDKLDFLSLNLSGQECIVRVHTWVEGYTLSELPYRSSALFDSWGRVCGSLSKALQSFDHEGAHRFSRWNPIESLFSEQFTSILQEDKRSEAAYFWSLFRENVFKNKDQLRWSVNYSDAHEHNLLCTNSPDTINGVIDFGDAIYGPTISELAIACAYAGMLQNDPITAMCHVIKGYNDVFPIEDIELDALFSLILGRLMITTATAASNLIVEPDNEYLQISVRPAWDLLDKLKVYDPNLAHYRFRAACSLEPHPQRSIFDEWLVQNGSKVHHPIQLKEKKIGAIDLSVGSLDLGNNNNFDTISRFEKTIQSILDEKDIEIGIGGYGEIRPFYTTDAYKVEGNNGSQWRTMHLGMDYWTDEETDVVAAYDGVIISIKNNDLECDYGPTIIVKHQVNDKFHFYTLYGHLNLNSLSIVHVGQSVNAGQKIGELGSCWVNGGWPPHLHFQVMLDLLGNEGDFPGVAYVSQSSTWLSVCPSMDSKTNVLVIELENDKNQIIKARQKLLGKSLSVSYDQPLHMVRGYKQYLYDAGGRRFLDTVNNVAHVGHEHPRVVKAAMRQIGLLNTNTRYLHPNIIAYAEALLSRCPKELEVVYFVNSGSEANELAIRMCKTYTNQKNMIALKAGYHGNTGASVDVSSYKFDGKGGFDRPEYTSIVPIPDVYRGEYSDEKSAGKSYASFIKNEIEDIKKQGKNVAGFICESILSCGGQIVLPDEYLEEAYKLVRDEGGLCIADEVQVGFGRVGSHFWGFELQGVVPDIVTCGKPIGNGHPLAAVIVKRKVADAFTNGMEYFNTYGGNPVSCAIGHEVLTIIEDEKLQENALKTGQYLLNELNKLKEKYAIIGDVRGIGFFSGIELVRDHESKEPADKECSYIANRMRERGYLVSTDGPLHNVLKMKPPMCFTMDNVDELILNLEHVLPELKWKSFV